MESVIDKTSFKEYTCFTETVKGVFLMKQNMTLQQCEQLSKERFSKAMREFPFVSDVEITDAKQDEGMGIFRMNVYFSDDEAPICFCIMVKANGEKRFVNQFIRQVADKKYDECFVFMAPYISDESAKIMKKENCSYMDLSGNCYIMSRRIMMYVSGLNNQFVEKRENRNYLSKTSGAASAVIRTMLNDPYREWQVKTLCHESGKAIGTSSNVKRFLSDRDWIRYTENGFKLQNISELLSSWAKEYHKKDARSYEFYSLDSVPDIEEQIAKWSAAHNGGALLGSFSAAARYAPTVRYTKAYVYVEPQLYDEFVNDLDLQSVSSGGNVVITIPHDETPCMYAKEINESYVTSPAQTVIDLLDSASRGEEAAEAIILKEYKEDGDD